MGLRLAQNSFAGGVISPELFARTNLDRYGECLKTAKNALIKKSGAIINRPGTQFIGEARDSADTTRILPFQFNAEQAYILEFGDEVMRPIAAHLSGTARGQILETAKNIVSITQDSPGVVEITGHGWSNGDKVFPDSVGGMVELEDGRVFTLANVATNTFTLVDMWGDAVDTTDYTAFTSGGTFSRLYQQTSPYDQADIFTLGYAQRADTMYLTHLGYAVRKLTRTAHSAWTFTSVTFGPVQASPTSPTVSATTTTDVTSLTTYSYKITAIDEDTGEESLPTTAASATNDLTISGTKNTVSWTTAAGAERYIVYKNEAGVFGFIGGTEGSNFIDNNIVPDLGNTPPGSRNPFSAASSFPSVCEFHEGRLWFAQTYNNPAAVWSSVSNIYDNLNVSSPAKADDAVSFRLTPGVNAVVGLASLKQLAVLTRDAEYTVKGGGVTEFITPSSIVPVRHSARGSAALRPIVVGDIVLFAQRQGAVIRAFGYSFEKDGFRSNDLTLLAPHFFEGHSIVDWCYQQDPHSIVWCVRDDGVLLCLTFLEDQNVFAWTDCYIGGTFGSGASATGFGVVESCASIEGPTEDEVYLLVKRTINGATKRYIELIVPRWRPTFNSSDVVTNLSEARFLDSHIVYDDTATDTITGLWHLEGQTVNAIADGSALEDLTVSDGRVTLPFDAAEVCVGLPYDTDIVPLPVWQGTDRGAAQGRRKKITSVVLKLRATIGIQYGNPTDTTLLATLVNDDVENWDGTTPVSGDTIPLKPDGGWDFDGVTIIRQSAPYPFELLGLYGEPAVTQ
jgi:hypothetical protein